MKCCPACGQLLPQPAAELKLAPTQRQLYELVRRSGSSGITASALLERLYTGTKGEPDSGTKIIHVMVRTLNLKLRRYRQRIVSTRGPGALYTVKPIRNTFTRKGDRVLTAEEVNSIRKLWDGGEKQRVLASKFGCSQSHISTIVHRGANDTRRQTLDGAREIGRQ